MTVESRPKHIGLLIPTLGFQVGTEIASALTALFCAPDYICTNILGGYLVPKESREDNYTWFYDLARTIHFDGLILYTGGLGYKIPVDQLQEFCQSFGSIPMVSIGAEIQGIPSIVTNNSAGMYNLVHQLYAQNPVHDLLPAAYIGGPAENPEARDRFSGWTQAMNELGMPILPELICHGNFTRRSGAECADKMLSNDTLPLPRIIYCANDLTAIGVMEQLKAANLPIPQVIGVTGFDNFEYAVGVKPGLTTVHNPIRTMATMAGQCLIDLFQGKTPAALQFGIGKPVLRGSTPGTKTPRRPKDLLSLTEDMLMTRDMVDRRVLIEKDLSLLRQDTHIFRGTQDRLLGAGIRGVWLVRKTPKTSWALTELALPGIYRNFSHDPVPVPKGMLVPPDLEPHPTPLHWLIVHPLGFAGDPLGYMLFLTDGRAAMLPELLSVQVTAVIQKVAMINQFQEQNELIRETRAKLDRAEKISSMGRLVAGLAHEMNTPIGTGITLSSFLMDRLGEVRGEEQGKEAPVPPSIMRFLEEIEMASDTLQETFHRLKRMVEDFKSLSSHNSTHLPQFCNIQQTIQTLGLGILKGENRSFDFEVICHGEPVVFCYPVILEEICQKLIQNTLEHGYTANEPGKIQIEIEVGNNWVTLVYRDEGKGIDPQHISRAFEPFYTTTRSRGNIGLGLHIIHSLVTLQLEGTIGLELPKDGGLQLTIGFPPLSAPAETSRKQNSHN